MTWAEEFLEYMQPFILHGECRKCRGERFRFEWHSPQIVCVEETGLTVAREMETSSEPGHLHVICERCGFAWSMDTADAGS